MRLVLSLILVLLAFAGNSILTRLAIAEGRIGAMDFAVIRTVSGAAFLAALVMARRGTLSFAGTRRLVGAGALTLYMLGFTLAYLSLDTGTGALILFGGTQVTMFAGALLAGERIRVLRWTGAALALIGLAVLAWPAGAAALSPLHAGLMGLAALGWGVYSLAGRGEPAALPATAANFALAAPLVALSWFATGVGEAAASGVALALASGVIASGAGYALWYSVLPHITATLAALAQLAVPLIAAAGGAILLAETPDRRFAIAALLILGGIGLGVIRPRRRGT